MDILENKLIYNIFKLIDVQKVENFKNSFLSEYRNEQVKNLFNELHDFVMGICLNRLNNDTSIASNNQFIRKCLKKQDLKSSLSNKRLKLVNESKTNLRIGSEPYLIACDVLGDYFYDSLNQGAWFKASIKERWAYGLVILYFTLIEIEEVMMNKECIKDRIMILLRKIDFGLIYSPPFLNNLLARMATLLHDYLIIKMPITKNYDLIDLNQMAKKNLDEKILDKSKEVMRIICPDVQEFNEKYFMKKEPVVIENAIADWPALQKWNLDFILKKAAYRLVPVEIGFRYTDQNWTQKVITIAEFIDKFIVNSNENKGYLAQYELFDRIEQFTHDFYIPDYCALSNSNDDSTENEHKDAMNRTKLGNENYNEDDVHVNAWFGPSNTISPLHTDPKDNLLVQVFGSKYIRLYSPKIADENYYIHDSNLLKNTSQVDVEHINRDKFPNFPYHYQEIILKKGEILYIPKKYWHYVRSLSTSFSISFWWK